jgi:hypothetical protein
MKHRVIAVLALLIFVQPLFVANAAAQFDWDVGVKGGVDVASLHGDVSGFLRLPNFTIVSDLKDSRTGFTGGLFLTGRVTPFFGIQFEALYSQLGGSGPTAVTQNSTAITTTDVTVEFDYLEFPVLALFYVPTGVLVDVSGFGGVSLGWLMNATASANPGPDDIDIDSLVKNVDLAGILGLGLTLKLTGVKIVADGRWQYSLKSIDNTSGGTLNNSAWTFMAGVAIPLGPGF